MSATSDETKAINHANCSPHLGQLRLCVFKEFVKGLTYVCNRYCRQCKWISDDVPWSDLAIGISLVKSSIPIAKLRPRPPLWLPSIWPFILRRDGELILPYGGMSKAVEVISMSRVD